MALPTATEYRGPVRDRLPPILTRILGECPELNRAYLVGGCVRDACLGVPVKDFDVEVYGISYERLIPALSKWGRADFVGESFGVVKLTVPGGLTFDFSVPRRDSKVAPGHRGFVVALDPSLTPPEAAARRDFTINSLLYDPREGRILDYFGGREDLQNRLLRHTSPAFVEDPLRVLRGMQFAGRFDLKPAPATVELCRSMKPLYGELAVERVREEWFKWAAQSIRPSAGLAFLAATHWIEHFPALYGMMGVPQDPDWHPEGDVWVHTLHVLDALAGLPAWRAALPFDRIVLSLAALLHDVGKAATTVEQIRDGRPRVVSPGHEGAAIPLADAFLSGIGSYPAVTSRVLPLVANHMAHLDEPTARAIRRLARRLAPATVLELATVMTADAAGRPPRPVKTPPSVLAILEKADELAVHSRAPHPILLGRHLIAAGLVPGPAFTPILAEAFEAQLDGRFSEESGAREWLRERLRAGNSG